LRLQGIRPRKAFGPRSACASNESGHRKSLSRRSATSIEKHPPRRRRPISTGAQGHPSARGDADLPALLPRRALQMWANRYVRGLVSGFVDGRGPSKGAAGRSGDPPRHRWGWRGSSYSSSSSSSAFFPRPMTSTSGTSAGSGISSMASTVGAVTRAISSSGSLTIVTPGGARRSRT
jgi:hypothetical protein